MTNQVTFTIHSTTTLSLAIVTLLPPLKHIRSFKLAKFSKLSTTELSILDPQPESSTDRDLVKLSVDELSVTDPQLESPTQSNIAPLVQTPSEILQQIGSGLREWREHYGRSIEDVSAQTQLQPRLIQAIETGDIETLPEPVYVRGMIKRYGDHLGLDGAAIAQNLPTWQREEAKSTHKNVSNRSSFSTPRIKPFHVYLGYILLIVGSGAAISHLLHNSLKPKPAILPQISAVTPILAPTQATQPQSVQIGITVKSPVWAQIGIDGTTKFTGNLQVGTQLNWVASKQVTISTNNAGALLVSRDQQPAQPVGKLGEKQHVTLKIGK